MLWNPGIAGRAGEYQEVEEAAGALGLELRSLEVRDHGALDAAFERASAERVDGLFVIASRMLTLSEPRVGEFARRHRLPMMPAQPERAEAGGLMAYGANLPALYRRAAGYVDKILKGANPPTCRSSGPRRSTS